MSLVEYHDPDGVFQLIAPSLVSRLPLKNLHWKSPFRPLRSIDSLHVDFVPSKSTKSSQNGATNIPVQRHQIPGLKSTPFLKIYFLRCDEKEQYKASKRKLLQDWVKDVTSGSAGGANTKQENHDACEWLILHVVLPGTVAATQPRFSKRTSGGSEQLKERSKTSKWPGGGARPILEKLRADFSENGKSGTDRVAQIRLKKGELPSDYEVPIQAIPLIPVPETPQEQESAWNDLISKFKAMILSSFDRRVTQYEEDVREKDAQRQMPGWNFCTFFVLKEGLTMAFESVGLLEDALAGYDELALGLENSVRNQNTSNSSGEATSFLEFTAQLQERLNLEAVVRNPSNFDTPPLIQHLAISSQYYRELIASNNISVFDFRRYIFSRQMTVLLLLAGIRPSLDGAAKIQATASKTIDRGRGGNENPQYLLELGHRAMQFITTTARVMKLDINSGATLLELDDRSLDTINNMMVSSWIYAVAQEVLNESLGSSIPRASSSVERPRKRSLARPQSKRRSSSQTSSKQMKALSSIRETQGEETQVDALSLTGVKVIENHSLASACAQRAELCLLQRRVLTRLAEALELDAGANCTNGDHDDEEEEEEDDSHDFSSQTSSEQKLSLISTFSEQLSQSLSTSDDYQRLYEVLSEKSAWYYLLAGRTKSAEKVIADLATLKFEQGDFAAAAPHYNRVLASFAETRWNGAETALLQKYAQCLKALNRKDEYVRVVLALLEKAADVDRARKQHNSSQDYDQELLCTDSTFADLVQYSRNLPYEISVPLQKFFDKLEIGRFIQTYDARDGFRVHISFCQLLAKEITVDGIRARLISTAESQPVDFWLTRDGPLVVGSDALSVTLSTNTSTSGRHIVDRVVIRAGKLLFTYETLSKSEAATPLSLPISKFGNDSSPKIPWILCYTRPEAVRVRINPGTHITVGKTRLITIDISSGNNHVDESDITIRPTSSGLYLHVTDEGNAFHEVVSAPMTRSAVVPLGKMAPHTSKQITVPYSTEDNVPYVSVWLEVRYTVAGTIYVSLHHCAMSSALPLDVTVQEIFHKRKIVSIFSMQPTSMIPLRIIDTSLQGPPELSINCPASNPGAIVALQTQPAGALFWTKRINHEAQSTSDEKMIFKVTYSNFQEEIVTRIISVFMPAVKGGGLHILSTLLKDTMVTKLKSYLTPDIFEAIRLTGDISLPSAAAFGWENILEGVPEVIAVDLRSWLNAWHEEHAVVKLNAADIDNDSDNPLNSLTIEFDVPHMDLLFTAALKLSIPQDSPFSPPIAAVGEAILGEITTSYTTHWSAGESETSTPQELLYEIHADPNVWLICGPRLAHFTVTADETARFEVCLIPLRAGIAVFPEIEVRQARVDAEMMSETNCTSKSRTVMVIEGLRSTTVGVGSHGLLRPGLRLLEAGKRSKAVAA